MFETATLSNIVSFSVIMLCTISYHALLFISLLSILPQSLATDNYSLTSECPYKCIPTCNVPNPKGCDPNADCTYCGIAKVWSEDEGKCVLIEDCPESTSCNGDPNARVLAHPPPCPSTCETPDERSSCDAKELNVGCVCNYGYILSREGVCVKPETCPGGHPCGPNATLSCTQDCPSQFCPVDDVPRPICLPGWHCRFGCTCKQSYLWKSDEDRTCILARECPEVPCTRPNEEWDACTPPCHSDYCDETYQSNFRLCLLDTTCNPQCRCKTGFRREYEDRTCIPVEQCPPPE